MIKYLAIDYGLRHLGLAINFGSLAEPWLQINYREEEEALRKLAIFCKEQGIEAIVLGISEGKMAERTRGFAQRLSEKTGLEVEFEDETLTSQEAEQRLIESGKSRQKRGRANHQTAAALILQAFLDRKIGLC